MNANQLKPASSFAANCGVKCICYGPAGSGKTPVINTAPSPVLLICEPGMRSMRNSNVPAWEGYSVEKIDEFFKWIFESKEAMKFDTVCIDSVSQMAEIFLMNELVRNRDGRKVYGEMSAKVMKHLYGLFFMQNKHAYLIAKQDSEENVQVSFGPTGLPVTTSTFKKRPYFPGKDLNIKVPHLYDGIFHLDYVNIPGVVGQQRAFRTTPTNEISARDRSGLLAMYEPPDLTTLFKKAMG